MARCAGDDRYMGAEREVSSGLRQFEGIFFGQRLISIGEYQFVWHVHR